MCMPARTSGKPVADQLGLVARRVVHDDVHIEIEQDVLLNHSKEPTKLGGAVARHALAKDGPCLDVSRHNLSVCRTLTWLRLVVRFPSIRNRLRLAERWKPSGRDGHGLGA